MTSPEKRSCCGFCAGIEGELTDGIKACRNPNCHHCHTPISDDGWVEEFDKLWNETFPARDGLFLKGASPRFPSKKENIKAFIKAALLEAEKRGREML